MTVICYVLYVENNTVTAAMVMPRLPQ